MGERTDYRFGTSTVIGLLGLASCQYLSDTSTSSGLGYVVEQARYELAWVDQPAQEEELIIETNRGYQIALSVGYLSNYSVRLYPCSGLSNRYLSLPIATAQAGHSDILVEGNWNYPVVEDLLRRETVQQEKAWEAHEVCDVVYTLARADGSADNLPEEIDLNGLSLYVQGRWQKSEQEDTFQWSSNLPAERVYSLQECMGSANDRGLAIRLTRDIHTLFDEIDFGEAEEQLATLQILTNIVQNTSISCLPL